MRTKSIACVLAIAALTYPGLLLFGQDSKEPTDDRALVKEGSEDLAHNQLTEAARAFQHALDLNPSSAKAHEGLGVALFRQLVAENVRPSAYSDLVQRAESHLKEACQLSPSASAPLLELSKLEAFLAERSPDTEERTERYKMAQDLLRQVISLDPSSLEIYLRLATLQRDEFGPPLEQAKVRFAKTAGPIPNIDLWHRLQEQYGALINDAITNARRASELNATMQAPLLLLSRLFRQRALLSDTQEQYATDMQSADDWERQFLSVGGHTATAHD